MPCRLRAVLEGLARPCTAAPHPHRRQRPANPV